MNINNVKRPTRRLDVRWRSDLNIQAYGRNNVYPQHIRDIIRSSSYGEACLDRYKIFIEGNGFNDTDFSEYECNSHGETIDDILSLVAADLATYGGFALHVNYNMKCEIVEVECVPFKDCRLEEENDDGEVEHIVVHPDWTGKKTRKGKTLNVTEKNITRVHLFNPDKTVVMMQILDAGGIEHYNGQMLWYSKDGKYDYPTAIYDKVIANLSIDEGLDNVKYRNCRNSFLVAGMLIHKKGYTVAVNEDGSPIKDDDSGSTISDALDIFQGDENSCAIMDVTIQQDEEIPQFKPFGADNFDKKFESTEKSVTMRIFSAFNQEVWYRILAGSLGFSSDIMTQAYEYYNTCVNKERRAISRAFKKIFTNWFESINRKDDYDIQPLVYMSAGSMDAQNQTEQSAKPQPVEETDPKTEESNEEPNNSGRGQELRSPDREDGRQ